MMGRFMLLCLGCLLLGGLAAEAQPTSRLPNASLPLNGSELIPLVQNGVSRKTSVNNISGTAVDIPWSQIIDTPTTLGGYGITNGATNGANTNITSLGGLTTPLSAGQGGTGFNGATAANGFLPIGNGAGFTLAPITGGSNVTVTNGAGSISIAAQTGIPSLTAGNCLTTARGSSGGTLTTTGTLYGVTPINAQSGVNYTIQDSDQCKLLSTSGNVLSITLPQAGAGGNFLTGWQTKLVRDQVTNLATLTPVTSTINLGAHLYLAPLQGTQIFSDGTNYTAITGSPWQVTSTGGLYYGLNGTAGVAISAAAASATAAKGSLAVGTAIGVSGFSSLGFGDIVTVSGNDSLGGGSQVTVSAPGSLGIGASLTVSGKRSTVIGGSALDNSAEDTFIQGSDTGTPGLAQYQQATLSGRGNTTAAIRLLTAPFAGVLATTAPALPNATVQSFKVVAIVFDTDTGGVTTFTALHSDNINPCIMRRGANAAATALVAGCTWTQGPTDGTITHLGAMSVTADTTLGGYNVSYTPGASNADHMDITAKLEIEQAQ